MADNQEPVDSGAVDSASDDKADVAKIKEELEFERKQRVKYETEAKKAFKDRDSTRAELDAIKSKTTSVGDEETRALVSKLQSDLKERDSRLAEIEANKIKASKLDAVKSELSKHGFKARYADKIEHFIDLDRVDPNEPISASIVVDAFRNSWTDLFEAPAEDSVKAKQGLAETAWSKPKFSSEMGVSDYERQYEEACKKRDHVKAQEILNKIDKLKGRV